MEKTDNFNNDYTFHKAPLLENICTSNITTHINAILKIPLSGRQWLTVTETVKWWLAKPDIRGVAEVNESHKVSLISFISTVMNKL